MITLVVLKLKTLLHWVPAADAGPLRRTALPMI